MSFEIQQLATGKPVAKTATAGPGRLTAGSGEGRICAFVKLRDDADGQRLQDYGCRVLTHIGPIYIADVPVSQLQSLSECDDIVRIETHTQGRLCLDVTAQHTHVDSVYAGIDLPQAYTGQGVLVGISDIGFDLTHPTFYNNDGTQYRVRRFLDQFTRNAESYGTLTELGVEYTTGEAILQKQHSGDATSEMHGTHCLGIAAGSGYDKPYRGMAYEADLCVVASSTGDGVYYSANEVAILKYIFDYADSIGQPCVITYSIGFDYVPGDDVLYHEALSSLLGPGHILVAAAGNENGSTKYMHKKPGQQSAGGALSAGWFSDAMTFRIFSHDDFTLRLLAQGTGRTTPVVIQSSQLPEGSVTVGGRPMTITRQDSIYTCQISLNPYDFSFGYVGVIIEGETVDAQVMTDYFTQLVNLPSLDSRLTSVETGHTVMLPGTLAEVVTVGAMNYSASSYGSQYGNIASFSSQGPTIDYLVKPDVVTPGVDIMSALNSFSGGTGSVTSTFNGKRYGWVAESGTSMATPAAAGVIALWLQAKPDLTPQQVLDVIAHTSRHPKSGLTYPNNTFGHGHIDAYRGLLYVLGLETSVRELSASQPAQATFRLEGRQLYVEFASAVPQRTELAVYNTGGQCVARRSQARRIDLSALPHGVYAVQLTTGHRETTGSTLIRL